MEHAEMIPHGFGDAFAGKKSDTLQLPYAGAKKGLAGAESIKTVHQRRIAAAPKRGRERLVFGTVKETLLKGIFHGCLPMTKHGSCAVVIANTVGPLQTDSGKGQATEEKFRLMVLTEWTVISLIPQKTAYPAAKRAI
jgi:hypothetical protein